MFPDLSPEATADRASEVVRRLRAARGFLFDMDGTLVLGDQRNHGLAPLAGALETTRLLDRRGVGYVVFTNGTPRTPQGYAQELRKVGFALDDSRMLTPASSAVELFVRRGYRRVMVLGGEGMTLPLREAGIEVVEPVGRPQADAVFIGWYREFSIDTLESACHAVWGGAQVFSASQSMFFATAQGRALGTSRPISAMIRDLTGCRINIVGKPSQEALRCAARRLRVSPRELVVVGDDPSLEMPMARRGGALAIAVRSGLGDDEAYAQLPEAQRPHVVLDGLNDLLGLMRS
ncbi:MAG: HAD hydrolase-like protein [Burkholderiaceae bacterium]|nr:HAD hydrolase-like protein [Burkholderiaceae bacterium]